MSISHLGSACISSHSTGQSKHGNRVVLLARKALSLHNVLKIPVGNFFFPLLQVVEHQPFYLLDVENVTLDI